MSPEAISLLEGTRLKAAVVQSEPSHLVFNDVVRCCEKKKLINRIINRTINKCMPLNSSVFFSV